MSSRACRQVLSFVLLLPVLSAQASPYTEVASAFDEGDRFDLHVTLDFGLVVERAEIRREWNRNFQPPEPPVERTDALPVVKDLLYQNNRQFLVPRLELGLFTDLSLSLALPIVLADSRELAFDDRGANQVDRLKSSTLIDNILGPTGFNADDPAAGFPDGSTIFRGPGRSGLDQLHLGVAVAPMNQARDDTKPTWKLGAELRVPVGKPMKFDRMDPGNETSVGRGLYELRLWTSIARRKGWAEPFVELSWLTPVGEASDSPFKSLGFGQTQAGAQQKATASFGFQIIAWERPSRGDRLGIDLAGNLEANFEGRAYTPMWEVFQFAGDAVNNPQGDLVLDSDPTMTDKQPLSHPGITNVENYLRFGGHAGLGLALGKTFRLGTSIELLAAQDHVLTFADAGVDGDDADDEVTLGTDEVNPSHVELIDRVGNRYRAQEAIDFTFLADMRLLF